MLIQGQFVRLDKLSAQRTPSRMLPTGYWLKGFVLDTPRVGAVLMVSRTERAAQSLGEVEPVRVAGIYTSTPVQSIEEHENGSVTLTTQNSVWKVTPIEADVDPTPTEPGQVHS